MEPNASLDGRSGVPRRREVDHVDLAAPPLDVWDALQGGRMEWPLVVRALWCVHRRALPTRGFRCEPPLALGALRSTPEHPGLQLLSEQPGRELVLGALVAMRLFTFELLPVPDVAVFARSIEPGLVELVWRVELSPLRNTGCRLRVELRIDAADDLTWRRFRRTYVLIGPLMRLVRRRVLASLADRFGAPELEIARVPASQATNARAR
jgi:hypothetical protein